MSTHNNTDFCTFRFDLEQSEIVSNLSRLDHDKLVDIIKQTLEKKNSDELSSAVESAALTDRMERDYRVRSMDELIECDDEPRDYKELTEQTRGL